MAGPSTSVNELAEVVRTAADLDEAASKVGVDAEKLLELGIAIFSSADASERLADAIALHLVARNPSELEGLAERRAELAERYGPMPEPMRIVGVEEAQRGRELRERVAEASLSREQAAQYLGISPQAVSERKKAKKLAAIRRGRETRFPAWQFTDEGTLPGLEQVIGSWPGSPLALATWAQRPSPDLDGRTPAEALRDGDVDAVIALERAIEAASW